MKKIMHAGEVPTELKQPLCNLLLALADDDFILGYWDSEWTGVAPTLEEDVACSSIAQDEIGHARLFYQEVVALTGISLDSLAYNREIQEYRQAQLVELQRGNWAFTIARQFLYESVDQLRVESLLTSAYVPLAEAMAKIQREEVYHQMHVNLWLERLAGGTPEARRLLEQAFAQLWPDALGMFETYPAEELLLDAGILTSSSAAIRTAWLAVIVPQFERLQIAMPIVKKPPEHEHESASYLPIIEARLGGRRGQHTQDFSALLEQMTMVYRLDPQAKW